MRRKVMWHPVSCERVTLLQRAADTKEEYLLLEVELDPGGAGQVHVHTDFEERIELVKGQLHLEIGGEVQRLAPGEVATVNRHVRHRYYNASDEPATFRVELRPAVNIEEAVLMLYGLAADGQLDEKGWPKQALHLGLLATTAGTYKPEGPLVVQRLLFGFTGWVARRVGVHRKLRQRYC